MNARRLRLWLALGIAATGLMAPAQQTRGEMTNAMPSRAASASGQFTAYAPTPLLASAACVFAERVKRRWLSEFDVTDRWRDPIIVVLQERAGSDAAIPAIRVDAFQNEFHLKYQITCTMPPPLDESSFTLAVVETLCEEFANRDQPTSRATGYFRAPIPPWLAQGITESIQGRASFLLETARRSIGAGRPQSASELVAMTAFPADPAERELFRADSWMLADGLLSLPNGAEKMKLFLAGLGATKSVSNAFAAVYAADFPQPLAFEKWWSLWQAQCAATDVAQNLSLDETARRLGAVLPTPLAMPSVTGAVEVRKQVSVEQLWRYYDASWIGDVLRAKLNSLAMLRGEAHPFYQSVIDGYADAMVLLMNQRLSRYRRAIAVANRRRLAADQRTQQITAYLDREERVYSPEEFAGLFAGYFQTLNQIQMLDENRHNPISDYLDPFDR